MLLPMVIAGLGIIFSIIGCSLVRISDDKGNVQKALNIGNWTSVIITTIACYFIVMWMMPANMTLRESRITYHEHGSFLGDFSRFDCRCVDEYRN